MLKCRLHSTLLKYCAIICTIHTIHAPSPPRRLNGVAAKIICRPAFSRGVTSAEKVNSEERIVNNRTAIAVHSSDLDKFQLFTFNYSLFT